MWIIYNENGYCVISETQIFMVYTWPIKGERVGWFVEEARLSIRAYAL